MNKVYYNEDRDICWEIVVNYDSEIIELFEDFDNGRKKLATIKQGWFKTTRGALISKDQMQAILAEWKKMER